MSRSTIVLFHCVFVLFLQSGGRGDSSDDLGTVLQQPLALGYFVSTAPAGQLPGWFWASCPQRSVENEAGVFLKSALHLHSHSVLHNLDDLQPIQQSSGKQHPLDSQFTTDVLRRVFCLFHNYIFNRLQL
jgi:mediator of RNA polymerase II transcription subunit 13